MKMLAFVAAGACLLSAASAFAQALAPAAAPKPAAKAGPSDHAQIVALENRFIAAFAKKDLAGVMAVYAKDGLFVFDVTPPREHAGWQSYKEDWEAFFKGAHPENVRIEDLSVTVVGPVAYGHSIQPFDVVNADGSKRTTVVRVTDVYRKIDGRWKIVQEHVSVPVDLDTGKADLLSKP